jgi:hypothetical protein
MKFESVYDNIVGFGRTKSVSYRMARGVERGNVWKKAEKRSVRQAFRRAVKRMREMAPEGINLNTYPFA